MSGTAEIVTEGTGWHEQLADRAELTLGFTATGPDRAGAVAALAAQVSAAEPALRHPALEVRHRRLSVSSEWRGDEVVGCRAGERVELLVGDVAALGEILAALVGTEPAELHGPQWCLQDPSTALRAAQQVAVADARTRAEGYADALGGRLGPLLRLSEGADHGRPVARMAAEYAVDTAVRDLGLEPEPVRVTVRCATTWRLLG